MGKNILEKIRDFYRAQVPVLIWGPPGVGKTATVEALAREEGARLIVPHIRAPEDIAIPVPTPDGVRMRPVEFFAEAIASAERGERVIVFVDEITTLPPAVQAAVLRFLDSGLLGSYRLPAEVWRVGAANPPEMAAGGWDLAAPVANRLAHLEWELDPLQWAEDFVRYWGNPPQYPFPGEWGQARSIVAAFVRVRPNLLLSVPQDDVARGRAWPSPRSWDAASRVMAAVLARGGSLLEAAEYTLACVGQGAGAEFIAWVREADLPDPRAVLENPALVGGIRRGDLLYAVLAAVATTAASDPRRWWRAAWTVMGKAAEGGFADVAAACCGPLADAWRREKLPVPPEIGKYFAPLLREAGLMGG